MLRKKFHLWKDSTATALIVFLTNWNVLQKAGVSNIMLFGIPDHKDEVGSGAYDENGIVQKALREAKNSSRIFIILQMCVCANILHMDTAVFSAVMK